MMYSEESKDFVKISKTKKCLSNYSNSNIGKLIKRETVFLDKYRKCTLKERLYYIEHDLYEIIRCKGCNTITQWNNKATYYCKKCVIKTDEYIKNVKKTKLDRYGDENYNNPNKTKKTKLDRYGDENYNNRIQSNYTYIKNHGSIGFANPRILKLSIDNYKTLNKLDENVVSFSQLSNIKRKLKSSINLDNRYNNWLKLYNNPHHFNDTELSQLYKNINNFDWLKFQLQNYSASAIAHKYGLDTQSFCKRLYTFGLYDYSSKSYLENEILEYCRSLSSNVLSNSRSIIKPLELDVYLADHTLAIEMNGLFWHSSECKDKDYHLNKTKLCQEKGIQLFHIFENEWVNPIKQTIWKSIIKNRLGKSSRIYARKTLVVQITSKVKTQFLIDNHLQGDCVSKINLGLYLDDELLSVMTFGKSRYDKKIDWELLRFCNRLETSVVGGAGKLLAAFRRENDGSIISYADKRRSTGGLYEALGFDMSHESKPNYWYWKIGSMELESRIKYQKHKLEKVLDVFDVNLTESENMYVNGYRKIYDCGNQVWKIL